MGYVTPLQLVGAHLVANSTNLAAPMRSSESWYSLRFCQESMLTEMDVAGKQCRLQWCRNHKFRILWWSWWIDVGACLKLAFQNLSHLHKTSSFRIKQRVFAMFLLRFKRFDQSQWLPIPIPPYPFGPCHIGVHPCETRQNWLGTGPMHH